MKELLTKAVKLIVKHSGKAWNVADGKKTIVGGILTAAGVGLMFLPGFQGYGTDLVIAGAPVLVTGVIHKIKKWKGRKEN